jgi:hypothetical protein
VRVRAWGLCDFMDDSFWVEVLLNLRYYACDLCFLD